MSLIYSITTTIPDLQNGDLGNVVQSYVGSTSKTLADRFFFHLELWKKGNNRTSASSLFDQAFGTYVDDITVHDNRNIIIAYRHREMMAENGFGGLRFHYLVMNCLEVINTSDRLQVTVREQKWIDHFKVIHPGTVVNKNRAFTGATADFNSRKPENYIKYLFTQNEERPKKTRDDSPERYIARMFYQNGDEDVSVPLSMINRHEYYLKHQRAKVLAKQKAKSTLCPQCGKSYNQIKVHLVSEKHKKREAQLALSPIAAKFV